VTLTYEGGVIYAVINHIAKYIRQRLFWSKVIIRT